MSLERIQHESSNTGIIILVVYGYEPTNEVTQRSVWRRYARCHILNKVL